MSAITIPELKLFLNREILTPHETELAETLLTSVEGVIEAYLEFPVFTEGTESEISTAKFVAIQLLVRLFNQVSQETTGVKSQSFNGLTVEFDLVDYLTPFLRTLLLRVSRVSLVA